MSCKEHKTENDPRPVSEIIAAILTEGDEDKQWQMVMSLQRRGTREVFDAALQLTGSHNPDERCVGVDIIAQLGVESRSFPEEARELLLGLLDHETDPDVLYCILVACGHNHGPGVVEAAAAFKDHPNEGVRYGLAFALLTREDEIAIRTLIELSADEDADVRNWATFGLAQQVDTDTPEIREALLRRLADENAEIRGEGLVGLARRGDERVVEPLVRELQQVLESDNCWDMVFEAAMQIGDSRAYPLLAAIKQSGATDACLDQAIAACRIPSPDEYEEPDDQPTTCPVCGLREAFPNPDEWQFCSRCGWVSDDDQRADPDLEHGCNRRSLNQERERWQRRLAH